VNQYDQKKQLERLLIDLFLEGYPGSLKGKLKASESPDFILTKKNRYAIGIELTRLYPQSRLHPAPEEQAQLEMLDCMIRNAQEWFEEKGNRKCFCKVLFKEETTIKPERMLTLSVRLRRAITDNVIKQKPGNGGWIFMEENLPEEIQSVLVFTHPGLTRSVWERSNNLGISMHLAEDIQYSMDKKEEKLRLYNKQNLDEYWLLITTDKLRQQKPIHIPNLLQNRNFHSGFHRVFLLELFSRNVFLIL
jgi:hypothetical protein